MSDGKALKTELTIRAATDGGFLVTDETISRTGGIGLLFAGTLEACLRYIKETMGGQSMEKPLAAPDWVADPILAAEDAMEEALVDRPAAAALKSGLDRLHAQYLRAAGAFCLTIIMRGDEAKAILKDFGRVS